MLLTQILATAFVIVGCCVTMYVCIYCCYCIVRGIDVDEYKLMVVVVFGVSIMCLVFTLLLFSLIYELTIHLILQWC